MKTFGSLADFGGHLLAEEVAVRTALEGALDRVLAKIEKTAKDEFGTYQGAVGPHPGWPELAESTQERRVAAGYTPNDPLLASGELKESTERERHGLEGVVGTKDPEMLYLEFGTSKMPARPVFGPAAFRNKETIQRLVGAAVVAGLIGGDVVHQALGYDFKTEE